MKTILAAANRTPKMFVAIPSPCYPETAVHRRGANAFAIHEGAQAPAPTGVPLKVLRISLLFIACFVLDPGGTYSGRVAVDFEQSERETQ